MLPVVLATRSAGKLRELVPLLESAGFRPRTLSEIGVQPHPAEDAVERFGSFRENAIAKARYFFQCCGGLAVLADDSGLEVVALGGAPGVHSKRWSGRSDLAGAALDQANNAKLLAALHGASDRSARYVCEAAWADASGVHVARGECAGHITEVPRGGNGFGYDPYFFSSELKKTFGEATLIEKARVSHRANAIRALF
ncbi:MAG: non-canonical purine NTP pyrophosphatase [Gemmatimonadaceae bacterium]